MYRNKNLSRIYLNSAFLFCSILVSCFNATAQYAWTGKVMDSANYEVLPFVTVVINHSSTIGTRTDMDGKFSFITKEPSVHLTISYVGYKVKELDFTSTGKQTQLNILIQTEEQQLQDVTVFAGENPAHRIIREAVKNADENNPEKLNSYSFNIYNKYVFTADADNAKLVKDRKNDTSRQMFEYLKGNYLMIMESMIETKFKSPGLKQEYVVATKVSGLKDPSFTLASSQLQPFSFYTNYITLVDIDYLNPVSSASPNFYFLAIEDTTFQGNDTIYHISFRPKKGKNFMSMKGMLFINSNGYAIQHVTAEPFDTLGMAMIVKVEQDYAKPDSIHWFPVRYNTDIHYNNFMKPGLKVFMQGRSYIDSIKINPEISQKVFDGISQQIDPLAGNKDAEYWNTVRADSLTEKEISTYHDIDSLGRRRHLDAKLNIVNGILGNELPIGFISIDLVNIVKINVKENYRIGLGLTTNDRTSRLFKIGGYAGYGLADKTWKYGGNLKFNLNKKYDYALLFKYSHEYEEAGGVTFYKDNTSGNTQKVRNTLIDRFDFTDRYEVSVTGRSFRFLNYKITAFEAQKNPAFNYNYLNENTQELSASPFVFSGIKFTGRYAYNEKTVETFGQKVPVYNPWPVVWFNITKGIKVYYGQNDYWKFDLKLKFDFPTKRFGHAYLQGFAGYATSTLPFSELYSCKGNYTKYGLYSFSNFQTMRANEFIYDQYAAVFWEQDFGSLIFKTGKFRPKVLLSNSVGIGKLVHPELHYNINLLNAEKPYTESGLILNNIVSKKLFGALRLGMGIGAYYRWGYYTMPDWRDNIALKLAFYVAG